MKLKGFILSVVISTFCSMLYGQTYDINLGAKANKSFGVFKKGSECVFKSIRHDIVFNEVSGMVTDSYYLVPNENSSIGDLLINSKVERAIEFKYTCTDDVWNSAIICNVLSQLSKKGMQNDIRNDMEQDALEYIGRVKASGLLYDDPYLENYVYSLIAKIAPSTLIDSRPGNVNLIIVTDPEMNACMFPNGTLVINTGLLSTLHSEGELVGILSHEIAHFVLDHAIQNVNKAIARQKRAEFWAALATGVTAVAEGYVAAKNPNYRPGAATIGMAVAASQVASQVVDRLGMKYNQEQEEEADVYAMEILNQLGYDKASLSSALKRIKAKLEEERSKSMYFASYTHPALVKRIATLGDKLIPADIQFEKMISFAITNTAEMRYEDRRFRQAMSLVSQNIKNKVGTADDYILKANCLLNLKNTDSSNREVVELIDCAKNISPDNISIYKAEIIATLRLNNKQSATNMLYEYIKKLDSMNSDLSSVGSQQFWDYKYLFISSEKTWANKMLVKLKGM